MLEINLDTSSLDRGLSQLLQNVSHPRKMMKAIATEMTSLTEENFESESFGGNRWKQSQRAAQGGQTLQLTGQLAARDLCKIALSSTAEAQNRISAVFVSNIHRFYSNIPLISLGYLI
ncbi:phage virion morphogenesis protein, partial [Neisseria flavescens]|uniref:phage virion morphogenesis protein n=1 Tax=Neisseria flavescens TaxID=484 RepID=UPI000B007A7B